MSFLLREYSRFLHRHPLAVAIAALLLIGLLPLVILYFRPIRLSQNAEIGFDTKDTELSGSRLAWQKLQQTLQTSNRINFTNRPPLYPPTESRNISLGTSTRRKRSWAEDLFSTFIKVPCYDSPIPFMNYLSQVVIEVPNLSSIFELTFLRKMCSMHEHIAKELSAFDDYTPYRNIWSIANFVSCLSPNLLFNCTELTDNDVDVVHQLISYCIPYRTRLITCQVVCNEDPLCSSCREVPSNCSSTMMFDLFYRLLPRDLHAEPLHLNTFLPVFTMTGYATQNIFPSLDLFNNLEQAIVRFMKHENLPMKGILMDVKRDRLLPAAIKDSFLAIVAAGVVALLVALHSRSFTYAVAVFLVLGLSVIGSLAFYSFFTSDFPLLNLVIFVLLIAVGTDDAFLLFTHFPRNLNEESFYECMAHTSATMFLTSFSTAVPFFVNIASNVVVFRCFGLFAGVTILINYFLVISFLPAFLILQRRYFSCFPSLPDFGVFMTKSFKEALPWVIVQGRYVWLAGLSMLVVFSALVAARDLHLPEYNPLQLFIASNPHEWYDNNAEKTFEFVEKKIAIPLFARVVWGVKTANSTAMFRTDAVTPLESDPSFSLSTPQDVQSLATTLSSFRALPFVNHSEEYWPEKFIKWSADYRCVEGFVCCNMSNQLFNNLFLDYCLRNSTSYIYTSYNDTPLFDNNSFALSGYTALLPTHLSYSHRFHRLAQSFSLLSALSSPHGWWAPEWALISTWYDLQKSIVSDVRSSVIVSTAVVALFSLIQLRMQAMAAVVTCISIIACSVGCVTLLGWEIGVLEAVILVLVVGLSFDYTLHFGAALPKTGCKLHRIQRAAQLAAVPVSLSASTSFLAGACMLFSQTHAFSQVGVFLIVLTLCSWVFATFFFLPLLFFTLRSTNRCDKCEASSTPSYPMNEKSGS
nr:abnormal chemotaxis protein 14 [Haemonchus contortus]